MMKWVDLLYILLASLAITLTGAMRTANDLYWFAFEAIAASLCLLVCALIVRNTVMRGRAK
jgi:hypothetical protein